MRLKKEKGIQITISDRHNLKHIPSRSITVYNTTINELFIFIKEKLKEAKKHET